MRQLTAIRPLVYATRRLKPGDDFTVKTNAHARVLIAVRKARSRREPGVLPPPPEDLAEQMRTASLDHDGDGKPDGSIAPEHTDDLKALRAQYLDVVGKRPFPGWDADTLRLRISETSSGCPAK